MRERIFRRVVLPAPLRPMRPRTSPSRTSSETSFNAQNVSSFERRKTVSGDQHAPEMISEEGALESSAMVALAETFTMDDDCGHRSLAPNAEAELAEYAAPLQRQKPRRS